MVTMSLEHYFDNYKGIKATVEENSMTKATIELAKDLVVNKSVLNLGLGNGLTSRVLEKFCIKQTVVEGSRKIINNFSFESQKTTFVESYFETFSVEEKFDVVLANHVLEHVDNPVNLMKAKFNEWLSDDGVAFITVPNAKSIHRLIGKEMGMLANEYDFNNSDMKAGHKRIYDIDQLSNDVNDANLEIIEFGGYNIKMVSLAQMKDWSQELLNAIFEVSKKLPPEICANLWMKIKKKS